MKFTYILLLFFLRSSILFSQTNIDDELNDDFQKVKSVIKFNKENEEKARRIEQENQEYLSSKMTSYLRIAPLVAKSYNNGEPIPEAKSEVEWNSYCSAGVGCFCSYEFNSQNDSQYGLIYNLYVIKNSEILAPKGTHLPKRDEVIAYRKAFDYKVKQHYSQAKVYHLSLYFPNTICVSYNNHKFRQTNEFWLRDYFKPVQELIVKDKSRPVFLKHGDVNVSNIDEAYSARYSTFDTKNLILHDYPEDRYIGFPVACFDDNIYSMLKEQSSIGD